MHITSVSKVSTLLASAFLFFSVSAGATTITTTNVNTWRSSSYITGGYSTVNFYPVQQTIYNTAAGITLSPSGSPATAFTFSGMSNGSYYLAGDSVQKTLSTSSNAGAYINIAFPTSGESAFLLGTSASAGAPLTFTFSDGQSFSVTSGVFGVSVSHSISWLQIAPASGSQAWVSDFWFAASALPQDPMGGGTPAPAPEPATILMTCTGALLLIAGSKKWKAQVEQGA